jgi:predicted dehydrogenase
MVPVDAPDAISFAGRLKSGAEVSVQVAAVPVNPTGSRLEIYGRDGMLTIVSGGALSTGPNKLFGAKAKETVAEMLIPDQYTLVPEGTPAGGARNVAQAYAAFADVFEAGQPFEADFDLAVTRHRLIDAIERSSREGRAIKLD